MAGAAWRITVLTGSAVAALFLASCARGGSPVPHRAISVVPQRIVQAPMSLRSVAEPQANGLMWVLAGSPSQGLFRMNSTTGRVTGSTAVSGAAKSVAESTTGMIGLALGTPRSGALELRDGQTGKVVKTVPLPGPARGVVVGSDGTTFYVLTKRSGVASASIVTTPAGRVRGTVPMPSDTVSVVPDLPQATLFALERNGQVDRISISGGKVMARFKVGDTGRSLALSPNGSTLYVLKSAGAVANIAVVRTATESVRRVLPAPRYSTEVLVSPSGSQLYAVVGTARYGNIQVFAA